MAHVLKTKLDKLATHAEKVSLKGKEIKKLLKLGKSKKIWKIPTKLK